MNAPSQEGPPNQFWGRLQAAVDQFGFTAARTKSRRHGHQPRAREHVEDYLAHTVLGESVRSIARSRGQSLGTVHESISRGRVLVRSGAAERGFSESVAL